MKNIHLQLRNLIGQIESAMIQLCLLTKPCSTVELGTERWQRIIEVGIRRNKVPLATIPRYSW